MTSQHASVGLPGGVGVSHLRVYDSIGPDGLAGGTPHLHLACSEAYLVTHGSGLVQTLSEQGYTETPLTPGVVAWFTAGTVHRLINLDGELELFVLMSNAGLPEAGDMVITFAPDVLADPASYRGLATLPEHEQTTAGTGTAARARRDNGVLGFQRWKRELLIRGDEALDELHRLAGAITKPLVDSWGDVIRSGPGAELDRTLEALNMLSNGQTGHLTSAHIEHQNLDVDVRRMGCCGTLGVLSPKSRA